MMKKSPLSFSAPRKLQSALEALARWGEKGKVVAGGTDLVNQMRMGDVAPECLVSLHRVPELREITKTDGMLRIGSTATLRTLAQSPLLVQEWSLLRQAVLEIGSEAIRNVGTLGGNICNASPAADSLPALLVMEAELLIRKTDAQRTLPISDFLRGPSQTALAPGEMLCSVTLPPLPEGQKGMYLKLGRKRKGDIALVGVALMLVPGERPGRIGELRIGLGGVAPTAVRAREAEDLAAGKELDPELVEEIARKTADASRPISDIRGGAVYKREVVSALVRDGLRRLGSLEVSE